jgi:hypothetical protein
VPKALERPSLTFEQATRLHAAVEKGLRDFDEVRQLLDEADVDLPYREAAESLARTWLHLSGLAGEKMRSLEDVAQAHLFNRDDGVSAEFNDSDNTEQTDSGRNQ